MKKVLLLIMAIFVLFSANSQILNKLRPTMVVWSNADKRFTLAEAQKGVSVKDTVYINIYFNSFLFENLTNNKEVKFEVRWYYYLSTRRELINIENINSKDLDKSLKGALILKSKMANLTNGWWEVQVWNSFDNDFLEIANINKFQILVNK